MTTSTQRKLLLTNGCSFTFGDELEDAVNERYSHHLSNMMDVDLSCIAKNASSNDRIFRTTMDALFSSEPDYVLIMWTAMQRTEFYCAAPGFSNASYNKGGYDNFWQLAPSGYKDTKMQKDRRKSPTRKSRIIGTPLSGKRNVNTTNARMNSMYL